MSAINAYVNSKGRDVADLRTEVGKLTSKLYKEENRLQIARRINSNRAEIEARDVRFGVNRLASIGDGGDESTWCSTVDNLDDEFSLKMRKVRDEYFVHPSRNLSSFVTNTYSRFLVNSLTEAEYKYVMETPVEKIIERFSGDKK